ncbi:MFS transporter [Varibaculum prostatecancerukia]|uniref:MFS transporter n=1 Tax=Varibaculum prostatecancerukia TaxID=2811781 RepID=UPI001C0021D5|nr:glycoside-pentoside-hexuronide (GPH):cation symporter [Varibaculum prostatecancerukia]
MTNSQPQTAPAPTKRPFGIKDKLGYMFGDFGNDFTFMLQMMFFMVFYTDVMGISPAHVGTLFLAARIVDAFTDVGMGRLLDLLKPGKRGRFRPWILRMCIPVTLASTMMYMPFVVNSSYSVRVTYMAVTYFIWGSIFYTSINIPYGSMAAVISDDPKHRTSLSVFRSVGGQLAFLMISAVLPHVIFVNNKIDSTRMAIAAIVCGICGILCYLACYSMVTERIVFERKTREEIAAEKAKGGEGQGFLKTLLTNRPLWALVLGALLCLLATFLMSGTLAYLWKDYFQDAGMMSTGQIVSIAPVFLLSIIATPMAMKLGKKEIIVGAMVFTSALCFVTWMLGIKSAVIFVVILFFIQLGPNTFNILIWAVLTDVLDYQELKSGQRDDGTVYAIYSWARKLGQALAGWLVGLAITWVGYDAEIAKAGGHQSEATLQGIYTLYLLIPAIILLLVGLIFLIIYPLTRKQVMANTEALHQRHAAKKAEKAKQDGASVAAAISPEGIPPLAEVDVTALANEDPQFPTSD